MRLAWYFYTQVIRRVTEPIFFSYSALFRWPAWWVFAHFSFLHATCLPFDNYFFFTFFPWYFTLKSYIKQCINFESPSCNSLCSCIIFKKITKKLLNNTKNCSPYASLVSKNTPTLRFVEYFVWAFPQLSLPESFLYVSIPKQLSALPKSCTLRSIRRWALTNVAFI